MAKKIIKSLGGLVYSTDPCVKIENDMVEEPDTLSPSQQKLRIKLETKHRGGKTVTLIQGFIGKNADRESLAKQLKTICGTGGSVKDEEIIIQGDNRDKIIQWLLKNGYPGAKKI